MAYARRFILEGIQKFLFVLLSPEIVLLIYKDYEISPGLAFSKSPNRFTIQLILIGSETI